MHPQVQAFLTAHQSAPTYEHRNIIVKNPQKWNAYKHDVLLLLGLYTKVYGTQLDNNAPFVELDDTRKETLYYNKQPISITDEEFRLIQPYSPIAYNE